MRRPLIALALVAIVAIGASQTIGAGTPSSAAMSLDVPASIDGQTTVAIEFSLPARVAALDGRLLFDTDAAALVGLAPVGGGTALTPLPVPGGMAFGAYGLNAARGLTRMRVVVDPHTPGELDFTIVVDAVADRLGNRLALGKLSAKGKLRVGAGGALHSAPLDRGTPRPIRGAVAVRDFIADGVLGRMDLDVARAAWEDARTADATCAAEVDAAVDANGDGCLDIVDIQLVAAGLGTRTGGRVHPTGDARGDGRVTALPADGIDERFTAAAGPFTPRAPSALAAGATFIVTSTADTPDQSPGNGVCADSLNRCTLRAAITESNWQRGDNRIEFDLSGQAPVVIQLGSALSQLQDRSGGTFIDGYSQPGARPNTATHGSNAVPGVLVRGTAESPRGVAMRITSANNTVRGILFNNVYRAVILDGPDAASNRVVGNLFGYTAGGLQDSYLAYAGVIMNTGAHHNIVGAPALEDRNVAGRSQKAVYIYGPGTENNVVQNNVLCITPSGTSIATCGVGIDIDFGPKLNLIGGSEPARRNVTGPTFRQGVEISHGWDPDGVDESERWQLNDNRIVGNWIGFRADGTYDASFRASLENPGTSDNGNGINVHDGANRNLVEGNWVSSLYDGIQTMSPNSMGNVIRGNVVGETPHGQPAYLGRDGIVVRINTRSHVIEGNVIRNARRYGVALRDNDILWVRVSRNVVTDMAGTALYFAQDSSDPTKGADGYLPLPVITSATTIQVSGRALAGATVEVFRASRSAGQVGLPTEFIAETVADANGNWSAPVVLETGERVTALQIMVNGNTSRLALNVAATFEQPPNPPVAGFTWTQLAGTQEVDFSDTSTGDPAAWTWDFGDGTGSNEQNPSHVYAVPGTYGVVLKATNAGGTTTASQAINVAAASTELVVTDTFTRSLNGGWGMAERGGAYTILKNASNYSVTNGYGVLTLPAAGATRSALLDSVAQRNVDIRVRVAMDKLASGASAYLYLVARRTGTNSEYRPRIVFNANGTASVNASMLLNGAESSLGAPRVVPGLTQVAGAFVWVRAEVTGSSPTTIRVKAWADGQPEPSGWLFTATNSNPALQSLGSVGLRSYVAPGTTNTPVQMRVDDYSVRTKASSTTIASDTFARTATASWKSAEMGGLYTLSGTAASYNVADDVGSIAVPAGGATRAALLNEVSERNVDIRFRVAVDKIATGGNYVVFAVCRRQGTNEYRPRLIFNGDGTISVNASALVSGAEKSLGAPVVVDGLTQSRGAFVWIHAQVTDANPTTIRVKAWADGQAEPDAWQFTAIDSNAALQTPGGLGVRTYVHRTVTNVPVTFFFDDYSVVGSR